MRTVILTATGLNFWTITLLMPNREESRDLADVWGLYTRMGLSIHDVIEGAISKATGIYSLDLARRLFTATHKDWEQVPWIEPPDVDRYLAELDRLEEGLILV